MPGRNDTEVRLKDTEGFASWARLIAASGMVAIVMDHSLGTQARSLARAGDDLVAALDYVRREAASLRVDAARVCVLAFATATPLLSRVVGPNATTARCVAGFYPQVDLTREDAVGWLLEDRDVRRNYSLASALGTSRTPALLVRAGRDQAPVNASLDSLRLRLAGRDGLSFLEHPDGEVGFERARADSTTRVVVRGTLCFLQRSLRVAETRCHSERSEESSSPRERVLGRDDEDPSPDGSG